jgi:hypothetical protein
MSAVDVTVTGPKRSACKFATLSVTVWLCIDVPMMEYVLAVVESKSAAGTVNT